MNAEARAIATSRLTLRPLALSDAPRLAALTSDYEVAKMLMPVPCPNPPIAVEGFLLVLQARAERGADLTRAVELRGEGVIGVVGMQRGEDADWRLGYYLGRRFWGQGFATEATRGLLEFMVGLGHRRFGAAHFVDNPASGRVLEKLGFRPTGEVAPRFSLARGAKVLTRMMRRDG